jgi:RNA polymerase sigma-70 factor (ECF subfamily)
MLSVMEQLSDEQLLASPGSREFAAFYRRHAEAVLAYFARRVHHAEAAADLTAETFAAAVVARERFHPERGPAAAWLYGIAAHKLADYQRRGRLEDRMRRELGMLRRAVSPEDVVEIEALGRDIAADMLAPLPEEQRVAVAAHVLDEASYEELARTAGVTTSAIRHRVSRGLRALRHHVDQERR